MWFRKSETPETEVVATTALDNSNNNSNNNNITKCPKPPAETSKFEKFRRASFRRKSLTSPAGSAAAPIAPRKRSQSPHFILQNEKRNSLVEVEEPDSSDSEDEDDDDDDDDDNADIDADDEAQPPKLKNAKDKIETIGSIHIHSLNKPDNVLLPLSDPPAAVKKATTKKTTLKALKTDPPKRKFYKNFTSRRQNSRDNDHSTNYTTSSNQNPQDDDDALPTHGKEKILLTDPKFRNNRIEKSSSKTKISDLEKRESIKRSRSGRKISAPPVLVGATEDQKLKKKLDKEAAANEAASKFTRARAHSNLNLSALVKFVVNNKKLLNANDFALMRRKSISEAASSIIAVAATCKPLPIALKYTQDGAVAVEPPAEADAKTAKNVVLVKKQNLKHSFCERNQQEHRSQSEASTMRQKLPKSSVTSINSNSNSSSNNKVKRNSSNSSKSSGNFEDEAFYSCDEQDLKGSVAAESVTITTMADAVVAVTVAQVSSDSSTAKRKSSSPSLTSRVAAKINETTNNYKNRKAAAAAHKTAAKKQRKTLATVVKRPEYYKQISVERLHSTSIVRQPSDRRPDAAANSSLRSNGNTSQQQQHNSSDAHTQSSHSDGANSGAAAADGTQSGSGGAASNAAGTDANALDAAENSRDAKRDRYQHQQNKSAPVSVNRSESYKERLSHKRNRNSRRKTSDPSLTSRPNDDQPDLGLSNSNYTASSNSSLSSGGGSESPSTSMEQVASGAPGQHQQPQNSGHPHHHHHYQHSHQDSFHGSTGGGSGSGSNANNISFWSGSVGGAGGPTIGQLARQWQFESDEEDDLLIEADWSSNVAADILSALTDAEKKRQEIINEIYQTERNHVRTLKLLERLFFCPLQESGVLSIDHLLLLFPPALLTLRELHGSFEQKLKQRRMEHNHVVNQVGDLLAGMFDGQPGEELREYAAQFCARQQIALEALKEKRRKDEQLQKILNKAESHKACRRLQLKDLLPTVLQRLTKYPLLFENLYKVTIRVVPDDVSEAEAIQRALESSKKILVDVNQAVKHAEDAHKLQNIQRKLDKSTFDKEEFKNLDLTQHRLIHDGSLTMKKNPGIQLHGLLFESMIVLLTKQDDKYSLKYLNATRISEVNNKPLSPIMNIDSETLVRQEAADKNSFFLIKTKTSQMLELRAPSSSECKTWFKHISDAAEQYKPRSKNSNHEPVDDPAIATLPHSNTKESLELTPERPPPISATATMTTTPLAPMMMLPNNNQHHQHHHHPHSASDLRNGREGTPTTEIVMGSASSVKNNRMNNNELLGASAAVNRTMSTRSCGESNNNYEKSLQQANAAANGVTLRHTQSARQATNATDSDTNSTASADYSNIGSGSKRDSTSIIYSNNSNNTRTLMQSSPPLVEPTAIQISISPAHTAEPVLTPAEKLRRLDASIRDGLLEKQKIICDMFRLPIEHFHEIVDIASLPEAPKDSADIALAAYAQVQSLTEVVNEYMKVTPEQEISAVSTSVCDQCHERQRKQQQHSCGSGMQRTAASCVSTSSTTPLSATAATFVPASQRARSPSPPPLPPPNKQQAQAQHKTATPLAKMQTHTLDEQIIHEDDDGYCEIDELRLPALPSMMPASTMALLLSKPAPAAAAATTNAPPLPPPAGTFKTPPTPPPPPSAAVVAAATATNATAGNTNEKSSSNSPELTKRQSTISADSIPEESADEVTQAMHDSQVASTANTMSSNSSSDNAAQPEKEVEAKTEETKATTAHEGMESEQEKQQQQQEEEPQAGEVAVATEAKYADEAVIESKDEELKTEREQSQEAEAATVADSTSSTTSTALTTAEGDEAFKQSEATENAQDDTDKDTDNDNVNKDEATVESTAQSAEPQRQNSAATTADAESLNSEHIEINDAYESLATLNKLNTALSMVDSMCQTTLTGSGIITGTTNTTHCGPNRIMHATSLEPSVPCHALNSIVTALNSQISLLLPKINERDMERERLRKENQHLRELLNAMHERQRVEAKIETPKDITTSADANDKIDAPSTNNKTKNNANKTAATSTATVGTTTATAETAASITTTTSSAEAADK